MLESWIQTKIIHHLESKWWEVVKTIKLNKSWYADLFVFPGNGIVIFIEVKKPEWKESKIQEYRRKKLTEKWYQCYVFYSYEEYLKIFCI